MHGFRVRCKSEKDAANLARAFRLRSNRIEQTEVAKYSLRVHVEGKTVYVTRKGPLH